MTENYLHQLWIEKRIPIHKLLLTDGRHLDILHFGYYNRLYAGPDFSLAVIEIDGKTFAGPIEMHVKASDWYKHGHQKDQNYQEVILHVVYEYDKDIQVNGLNIPTLELKQYIDKYHFASTRKNLIRQSYIPCKGLLGGEHLWKELKEAAIQQRIRDLRIWVQSTGIEFFHALLARSFGRGQDHQFYLNVIRDGFDSGFEDCPKNGLRPTNTKLIRIPQLLCLFQIDPQELFTMSFSNVNRYLESNGVMKLGREMWGSIRINALIPHAYLVNRVNLDQVFQLLRSIPAEENRIIKNWRSMGVSVKNAFDSQGLLWLYKSKCEAKKCLTCTIGKLVSAHDSKSSLLL